MVSLDLGGSGLRAVQFRLGKGAPTVTKVASCSLPDGAVRGGEVTDVDAVATALKGMWAREKLSAKRVVFGVANHNVLVRLVDVDWMPEADFKKTLPFQVSDSLSMDIEDANLDYHVLSEFEMVNADGSPRRMVRILLVAATKATVNGFVAAIEQAGLQPVKADLVPFALIRAAGATEADPGTAEAVIDIGADVTNVIIHQGGQPRFVRIVCDQAGRKLTNALVQQFSWSLDDAEQSKIALGLGDNILSDGIGETVFGRTGGTDPAAAHEQHPAQHIINHVVSGFIGEIHTSLDYFLSQSTDISSFSRIVLTGGTGNARGLRQRLASELRIPVEHGAPLSAVRLSKGAAVPDGLSEQQLSVAVGLALGAAS